MDLRHLRFSFVATSWYLVASFSRFAEASQDAVRVKIDCHSGKKKNVTNNKLRTPEPTDVIIIEMSESSRLKVTIASTENKSECYH